MIVLAKSILFRGLAVAAITGLVGCASYQSPTEGELASVTMTSSAFYTDVQVDYCLDESCDDIQPVGQLVGSSYLEVWKEEPSVLEVYSDRQQISVNVYANQKSTFRFTTEKTVNTFEGRPRKRSNITYAFGTAFIRTWYDYSGDSRTVMCRTAITLEPNTGAQIFLKHEHDEETEECTISVSDR